MALGTTDIVAVTAAVALALGIYWRRKRSALPYPPGPTPTPLIGNIKDIPTSNELEVYGEMARKYGGVVHLKILWKDLLLVNSMQAATDLLDKRSTIYSDRPQFVMLGELMGWGWTLSAMSIGDAWLTQRRVLQTYLQINAQERWMRIQRKNSLLYMLSLLDAPQDFWEQTQRVSGANIMEFSYGIQVALHGEDPYVKMAENAVQSISRTALPGSYLCDWIPWVKYVPKWFPGAKFKRDAEEWRKFPEAMRRVPLARVKEDMAAGRAQPSVASELLEGARNKTMDDDTTSAICAGFYLAGAVTTTSIMFDFIHEMVLHPDMQRKAQQEVDSVIGRDRLPEYSDRTNMPYIEAIIRELYRCYPVAPLSVPRAVRTSDEYKGMYIPGGATLLVNIWYMLRDPAVYPDPHTFKPERWLKNGQIDESIPDSRQAVFGFGRRLCPGRFFAESTIWLAIADTLSCFDISTAFENGVEIDPTSERTSGGFNNIKQFKCAFTPRSPRTRDLVQNGLDLCE